MASIRRKKNKWQAVIRRAGEPTISRSFISKTDARKWALGIEQKLDQGACGVKDRSALNVSLAAYLARYEKEVSAFKASHNVERYIIGKWLAHYIANLAIGAITTKDFSPILHSYKQRYKPETIRKDFGLLRHMFNIAITQWGVGLSDNPVEKLKLPPTGQHAVRRLPRGAWAAFEALYTQTTAPEIYWLSVIALETAMRRSELLRLEWSDIDRSRALITVREGKNGHARFVPMTRACEHAFAHLEGQGMHVFAMSPSGVANAWVALRKAAGYPSIRFHDLRHEAISRLFEKGLSVPEVASISGHKTPSQLFRYAHGDLDRVRQLLE